MSNGNAENVSPNPLSDVMQYVYAKAAQLNAMNDGAGYGANANNCDACIRQRRAYQRECVWTANVDGGDGQDTPEHDRGNRRIYPEHEQCSDARFDWQQQ